MYDDNVTWQYITEKGNMAWYIREGKSLLCEAEQLEAVFCGAWRSFNTAKAVYYSKLSQVTGSKGSVNNLR